ncbi:hypothetical protein [Actinomadura rubrisoli]|uniref:Lipoprotein n=1 Tax=Actinomadura rubrisoli TaxID=2530368 RepID=A0A4R5AN17_9ACTN|nr:hypothetical protein [Actinomadura rubrisoli]TDD73405.1 hypothetical protein E1298_34055 [Actinomadura rubrisoli]
MRILYVAVLVLVVGGCSSDRDTRKADCATLAVAMTKPAQLPSPGAGMAPMYQKAAADVRAARAEIKDKKLVVLADAVIRGFEEHAKYEAAHPRPRDLKASDGSFEERSGAAENAVIAVCGPLREAAGTG